MHISKLVACVFGSIRRIQISGEFSPRSGKILSHLASDRFLTSGAFELTSARGLSARPINANQVPSPRSRNKFSSSYREPIYASDSNFIAKDSSSALTSGFHATGDEGGSGGGFNDDVGGGGIGI